MPVFAMPIVLMVEADSVEEAQKVIDDWSEEIDMSDDLPIGTEDLDTSPSTELNDEGQRVLYLPAIDEADEDIDDEDRDDEDDFNGSEEDF
jgi:hypothetical protein